MTAELVEIRELRRSLTKRAANVLGYSGQPGSSNDTTEAINGRLEFLRRAALGFRNARVDRI